MDVITATTTGLTAEAYAARKGFDSVKLARWGVVTATNPYTGAPAVALPYRDVAGQLVRNKYRTPTGTVWDELKGVPLILYGLWFLPKAPAPRPAILVEGESDCHAGWHHGWLVLGLPGASTWRSEWTGLFEKNRPIYVWREPDNPGTKMVSMVAADLPQAKVIEAAGVKDLADLHLVAGPRFSAELRLRLDGARPIRDVVIPRPRTHVRISRTPLRPGAVTRANLEVERARSVPLDQLMGRLGFEVKRRGHEWVMICPFHDDRHPSLRLNAAKGVWRCDPCGLGGDTIAFLMRWRGLAFPDAVRAVVG